MGKPGRVVGALCSLVAIASLTVLSSIGCGGGGGGGGLPGTPQPTDALFSRTYHRNTFYGVVGAQNQAATEWGETVADGMGNVGGGQIYLNVNGALGGPFVPLGQPYSVQPGYGLSFGGAQTGGISTDGRVAILGETGGGAGAGIVTLLRRQGTFSAASLNGTYHLMMFLYLHLSAQDAAFWGTATFDGQGNSTSSVSRNDNGVVSGPSSPPAGTYSVAADGTVTWTRAGNTYSGGLLEGGDLAILTGGTVANQVPVLMVLIRAGQGLSNATLSGAYHTVGLLANAPAGTTPRWRNYVGASVADGVSQWSLGAGTMNSDGVVLPVPPLGVSAYAVAGNGALTMVTANWLGGVTPTGSFAAVAGGATQGDAPQLWLLVR